MISNIKIRIIVGQTKLFGFSSKESLSRTYILREYHVRFSEKTTLDQYACLYGRTGLIVSL